MTTKVTRFGTVLCLMLCWTTGVFAQTPAKRLSLEQAVQMGVEHNLTLAAARQTQQASKWGVRKAYSNWLPTVEINSGYTRLDGETVRRANIFTEIGKSFPGVDPKDIRPAAYKNAYSTSLTVIQPLYNSGAEYSSIRLSKAAHRASKYSLEDTKQEVIVKVKRAYFNILKAQELLNLMEESVESTRRHLVNVRRMLEVGSRSKADVLRWEVQLVQDEGNMLEAENHLAIAIAALNEAMGMELEENYELLPISEGSPREGSLFQDQIVEIVQDHPAMRAMKANVSLQRAQVRLAQGSFQPKVNLVYSYGWEKDDDIRLDGDRTWTTSVQVSFPLFNGFGNYSAVRKAKAELRKTEESAKGIQKGMELQAKSAWLNLKAAQTRIGIARKGVELGEENLRVVKNMYDAGLASNIDFIDAQLARNGVRVSAINALYDFYIAQAELERALGLGTK